MPSALTIKFPKIPHRDDLAEKNINMQTENNMSEHYIDESTKPLEPETAESVKTYVEEGRKNSDQFNEPEAVSTKSLEPATSNSKGMAKEERVDEDEGHDGWDD
jgi:hypothetical protein